MQSMTMFWRDERKMRDEMKEKLLKTGFALGLS